jgi:hypothetical protein
MVAGSTCAELVTHFEGFEETPKAAKKGSCSAYDSTGLGSQH